MTVSRITVRLEIDVDQHAWSAEYGTAGDINEVEDYLFSQITLCPAAEAGCYMVTGFSVQPA